jgi:2-dehydropantoate 2-reductase
VRVAVLGPGGVGGLVAAALDRAGIPTTVVARPETAERIAAEGIRVRSVVLGDFEAHPEVTERLTAPVDVLVVATKATTLDAALDRLEVEPGLVVPLLNGVEHVARLRARLGARVAAATIRVESERVAPGEIAQTSRFLRVEVAANDPALREELAPAVALLERAGIPALVGPSEAQVLWSKLARLCALACTTAAYGEPLGPIREDPERRAALEGAVRETIAVARAEGADLDAADTLGELAEAHPELQSSLARDLAVGRETELDAIAGAVLRAAARHGIECATVAGLAERIRARERRRA